MSIKNFWFKGQQSDTLVVSTDNPGDQKYWAGGQIIDAFWASADVPTPSSVDVVRIISGNQTFLVGISNAGDEIGLGSVLVVDDGGTPGFPEGSGGGPVGAPLTRIVVGSGGAFGVALHDAGANRERILVSSAMVFETGSVETGDPEPPTITGFIPRVACY